MAEVHLTDFEILRIESDVREGRADPSDARRLLQMFCDCVDGEIPPPRWLLLHLRDSCRRYLDNNSRSMEAAFGLKRRKGRPNASEERQIQIAAEVMRRRLAGTRHQEALEQVAEHFGFTESVIGEAYSTYRISAVAALGSERPNGFTDAERGKLQRLLPKKAISHTGKIEL